MSARPGPFPFAREASWSLQIDSTAALVGIGHVYAGLSDSLRALGLTTAQDPGRVGSSGYYSPEAQQEAQPTDQHPNLNSALLALPVLFAQLALENLAVSTLWQFRDKLDCPRLLIAGQVLPAEDIHFLLC